MWWYGKRGGKAIGCSEKVRTDRVCICEEVEPLAGDGVVRRHVFTDINGNKLKAIITYDDRERAIKIPWVVSKLLNVEDSVEVIVTDEGLSVPRVM